MIGESESHSPGELRADRNLEHNRPNQQMKLYPTSWQYPLINYLDLDSFYTLMYDIVNLHSQYALFTFFYPLFFSCYVHCTAVYTVCCPVHSCSLTVVLPERTIYSHFVYFFLVKSAFYTAEIGAPHCHITNKWIYWKKLLIWIYYFLITNFWS